MPLGSSVLARPLTLLAEGLLEDRLVKAAEGGTEIFEFGEQELLVPVGHVVLGLGGLLEVHGLGHGLRVSGHLRGRSEKVSSVRTASIERHRNFLERVAKKRHSRLAGQYRQPSEGEAGGARALERIITQMVAIHRFGGSAGIERAT